VSVVKRQTAGDSSFVADGDRASFTAFEQRAPAKLDRLALDK
jgi:hypothetical protein